MGLNGIFNEETKVEFRFPTVTDKSRDIIKVIGVGGGGGNAVKNMIANGVENVSFAVVNTDSQALAKTDVPVKLQIGHNGLGVGGRPELGREAAEYSIENIKKLFEDETKMVFITAGLGGGTGTGAAPVIARVARELDILTVGVVTLPFAFEKKLRIEKALKGVDELKRNVDALLVINNERLMQIYSDGMTTISDAFEKADEIITTATKSIAEIITLEGKVNRDFCDVQTVMKDGGGALMSEGRASGEHRIMKAMANALNSPLLNNVEVEKSQRLLYIIYQSHKNPVLVTELKEVNQFMDNMANDLEVLWGLYWDDSLGDDVKVNIISTGFDKERSASQEQRDEQRLKNIEGLYSHYYGNVNEESEDENTMLCTQEENGALCNQNDGTMLCTQNEDKTLHNEDPDDDDDSQSSSAEGDSESSPHRPTWLTKLIEIAKHIVEDEES